MQTLALSFCLVWEFVIFVSLAYLCQGLAPYVGLWWGILGLRRCTACYYCCKCSFRGLCGSSYRSVWTIRSLYVVVVSTPCGLRWPLLRLVVLSPVPLQGRHRLRSVLCCGGIKVKNSRARWFSRTRLWPWSFTGSCPGAAWPLPWIACLFGLPYWIYTWSGDLASPGRCRAEGVEPLWVHQFVRQGVGRVIKEGGRFHRPSVVRWGNGDVHRVPHSEGDLVELSWSQKQCRAIVGWVTLHGSSADAPWWGMTPKIQSVQMISHD